MSVVTRSDVAPRTARAARATAWFWPAVGVLVLGAALLRIRAAEAGFFGDELFSWDVVDRSSLSDVLRGVGVSENTPPLYYFLAWLAHQVDATPQAIRAPSVAAGVLTVPVTAELARRLSGPLAGVLAGALVAFSPFAVFYGSEARAYALATLCVAAATLSLVLALESDRRRWWLATAVASALALWSHYTAALPVAAQLAVAAALFPWAWRRVALVCVAIAVLYAPWLPFFGANVPLQAVEGFEKATFAEFLDRPVRLLIGYPYLGLARFPGVLALIVAGGVIALAVAVAVAVVAVAARRGRELPGRPAWPVIASAAAPMLGLGAYALVGPDLFEARNVVVGLPALAVVVAMLLAASTRRILVAGGAALAVVALWGAVRLASGDARRPAYREVAQRLDRVARPAEPIIDVALFPFGPLRNDLASQLRAPHRVVQSDRGAARAWRAGRRTGRVFVVYPPLLRPPRPPPGFELVARTEWGDRLASVALLTYEWAPRRDRSP